MLPQEDNNRDDNHKSNPKQTLDTQLAQKSTHQKLPQRVRSAALTRFLASRVHPMRPLTHATAARGLLCVEMRAEQSACVECGGARERSD